MLSYSKWKDCTRLKKLAKQKECDKMYLHICKNVMIKMDNIIGIFDKKILEQTKEYKQLLDAQEIEDISEGEPKSFILVKEKETIKWYLSNISVATLEKRTKTLTFKENKEDKNGKI